MKARFTLLLGGAVGYVLGTRAGRERYEQIKSGAQGLWENPKVQEKRTQAQEYAREKAPEVQHKVSEAATSATAAAKQKIDDVRGDGNGGDDATSSASYPTAASTRSD